MTLFSKLSNCYFDLRPLGQTPAQDRGTKSRLQGHLECANPQRSPGEGAWPGLKLNDTLAKGRVITFLYQILIL